MTKEKLECIINNLVKQGLTRGEAYVKVRRMLVTRLEFAARGSAMENRFIEDLDLLDKMWMNR